MADRFRHSSDADSAEFDSLFRQWYAPLVRATDALVHDRAIAEEIVQEVLLAVWQRWDRFAGNVRPQAYLFKAARNRALNHLRNARQRDRSHLRIQRETAPAHAPEAENVDSGLDAAVAGAVAELPERCREIFELSRFHGLKYSEIADVLDISVKTVEAQMGKALKTLRERLGPWLEG